MNVKSEHYTYLIIGGGMTADAAVQGIRSLDRTGRIGILSQESDPPYDRPPLTKGLWFGKPVESISRKTGQHHIDLLLDKTVVSIDSPAHIVTDQSGSHYSYDKLLLATGGAPKRLDCPQEGVIYFRTLADYRHLKALYAQGNDFVVIGGGFIGSEIAAALTMNGKNVTMIFKDPTLGARRFPEPFSCFLNAYFTEQGVKLVPGGHVKSITPIRDKWKVTTHRDETFFADGVIGGLGIVPNIQLAQAAGAACEDGIVVDEFLCTSLPDIWAAGDVANFYSPHLEKRIRIEHEDAANSMGSAAGRNMAGAHVAYTYLPFFYSDLFEISYEAIGEISSEMEIIEDWSDPNLRGTIYFLRDGQLRGALVVGIADQIPKIREIIASHQPFSLPQLA